jgi:hypothetical protein
MMPSRVQQRKEEVLCAHLSTCQILKVTQSTSNDKQGLNHDPSLESLLVKERITAGLTQRRLEGDRGKLIANLPR